MFRDGESSEDDGDDDVGDDGPGPFVTSLGEDGDRRRLRTTRTRASRNALRRRE